ncbi:MAG: minor capsid protein [Turicibacter sp.]|nr:minor capsid protein [Turicibacter sp.]
MALRINPQLLNQSFEYHEFEEKDNWQTASYKAPITIKNVRLDETLETTPVSAGEGRVINKAIAFIYASDTTPFIAFKRQSKVVTNNGIYTINKVVKVNEPFKDKLWSVELELV